MDCISRILAYSRVRFVWLSLNPPLPRQGLVTKQPKSAQVGAKPGTRMLQDFNHHCFANIECCDFAIVAEWRALVTYYALVDVWKMAVGVWVPIDRHPCESQPNYLRKL